MPCQKELQKVAKKLFLKPGNKAHLINPPHGFEALLEVGDASESAPHDLAQWGLIFVYSKMELELEVPLLREKLGYLAPLWVGYQKGEAAKRSGLNGEAGWGDLSKQTDLIPVSIVSLDEVWSSIRFKHRSEIKTLLRTESEPGIGMPKRGIQDKNRDIEIPPYIKDFLANHHDANLLFEKLSYSHKKEYITWIEEAKRPETREKRLAQMLERLTKSQSF